MSGRNLFVIKSEQEINNRCIYDDLYRYMETKKFGIVFEPQEYCDELLNSIDCKRNYFAITDNHSCLECGDLFSTIDSFEFAIKFSKKQFASKEYEYLYQKLAFLNEVIKIVFHDPNVEKIEIYISDQYSTSIEDYTVSCDVTNGDFTKALIKSFEPIESHAYYGMKTMKFLVKNLIAFPS